MRIRTYSGFGAFGTINAQGKDCPPSGSWEAWCDCMFSQDEANRVKCRAQPIPFGGSGAPWTTYGAIVRGIPKPGDILVQAGQMILPGGAPPITSPAPTPVPMPAPAPIPQPQGTVMVEIQSPQQQAAQQAAEARQQKMLYAGGALALGLAGLAYAKIGSGGGSRRRRR